MRTLSRFTAPAVWLLFALLLLLQLPTFLNMAAQGRAPIDFLSYQVAANALARAESPYRSPEAARDIWRLFHQDEARLLAASTPDEDQVVLRELNNRPQQPGPYVYPPTLALLIAQLSITPLVFALLTLLSIFGFTWFWLKYTGASPLWSLLVITSLELLAALNGGNVELILLAAALLAARLLWVGRELFAAPFIALLLLIKPFYALFFVAFLVLK